MNRKKSKKFSLRPTLGYSSIRIIHGVTSILFSSFTLTTTVIITTTATIVVVVI